MHKISLHRAKHSPNFNSNSNLETSDHFYRRGLLDISVSLPSIPLLDPLITPLVGGPENTPTPGGDNQNPVVPLPTLTVGINIPNPVVQIPTLTVGINIPNPGVPSPTLTPEVDNPNPVVPIPTLTIGIDIPNPVVPIPTLTVGINTPNPVVPIPTSTPGIVGIPNPGVPAPIPTPTPGNNNSDTPSPQQGPPPPQQNPSPPHQDLPPSNQDPPPAQQQNPPPPAPTPNPETGSGNGPGNGEDGGDNIPTPPNSGSGTTNIPNPDHGTSPNPSTPTPNPGFPDSDPTNSTPQNGAVNLAEPSPPNLDSGDSSEDSNSQGNVIFTTISGVRTQVTQLPHTVTGNPGNGPTGGGDGPGDGGGGGSGNGANSSGGRSLGPGIIAAIIIGIALVLALLVFFLRKRAKKRQAVQRRRWLSNGEKGPRTTFRSSFGDLRASTFGYNPEADNDNPDNTRNSGPFSDWMVVPSPTPQMIQVTPPAIAVHSTGRNSRNSQFSIGSSESGGTDGSEIQWVQVRPDVGINDNISPTSQFCLPSPISVRPFTPTESWSFPKPPVSRDGTRAHTRESKGQLSSNPFADPVPQPSSSAVPPLAEVVRRNFEPTAEDELAVEIGDEVSVLRTFDDGWAKVKMLRRNESIKSVQGLEGLIPVDCLRPKGSKSPFLVDTNTKSQYT